MKRILLAAIVVLMVFQVQAQMVTDSVGFSLNTANRLLISDSRLTIGGYGEVHFNQPMNGDQYQNGTLDVHRVVLLFGYNFNDRTQFVTEIEYEHVSEVYVEQAFLQYKLNNSINFRGGLMLIPMGIVNEYHEPTTFNGVERPLIDKTIAPTTWREIGVGITGNVLPASIRYQAYIVGGFNGYSGSAKFNGKNGFRSGRQKGAEAYVSSPNFTGKVEYFGARGLNLGLSGYFGKSMSTLYDGVNKNDADAVAAADSSTIGIAMIGADARYSVSGLELRGQLYYSALSNTKDYNEFGNTDLGSSMYGYYVEAGYNVLRSVQGVKTQLVPFIRYENFDTHNSVEQGTTKQDKYNITGITTGLTWRLSQGAVVKADMQFVKSKADDKFAQTFNAGVGIMF